MKHIKTFKGFLSEAYHWNAYKGSAVIPKTVDPAKEFGLIIKSIKEIKKGEGYAIFNSENSTWQAELIYQGKKGKTHIFQTQAYLIDAITIEFTDTELTDEVTQGKIIKQN